MTTNLASTLAPQLRHSLLLQIATILVGSLLLAVSARVQVPFWPVPMTMQTFVVLLLGMGLGARLAGATVFAYLAEGAMGLPVFASGTGLAYMAGPTAGYLFGFLAAAILVGWLADKGYGRTLITTLIAFAIGEVVIFTLGAGWLAAIIGVENAITAGILPFLPAEALKIALACAVLPLAWKLARD